MDSERRRAPRYQFVADAEVTETASETRLKGRTSDLSISGCFLDMLNPSPEGTAIRISISQGDTKFTALGRVVFILPNLGMGVSFTSVEPSQLAVLQKWLAELCT
jgi:PilZ domain